MRRLFLLLGFFSMLYSGCSKTISSDALTIWESYNDEEHTLFLKIVQNFEKDTGIKVEVQRIPFFGMESKILTALATRSTPDIARVDLGMVAKLATRDGVMEIKNFDTSHILPQALKSVEVNGKLYGIPDQVNCLALFYNKNIFRKKGVNKPPDNWKEFLSTAQKLTDKKEKIYGFGMRSSLWWSLPFFYGFGAKLMSNGKFSLDSPEGIRALTYQRELYLKYKVEAGAWKPGAIDPDVGFQNGKYAMVFNGPWKIKSLLETNISFGVALLPRGKYGRPSPIGGTDMVIFKNTKMYDKAIKFLKYLTSENTQTQWANELGEIPVNVNSMNKMDLNKHPYLQIFKEAIKEAVPRPIIPDYQGVENIVNPEIEAALSGKKTQKEALRDATRRVNEEIFNIH